MFVVIDIFVSSARGRRSKRPGGESPGETGLTVPECNIDSGSQISGIKAKCCVELVDETLRHSGRAWPILKVQ